MRNETDWAYLPQSEERVVAKQIKERSRQDAAYQAKNQIASPQDTQGGFALAEAIQCTYIDLMRQIEMCDLSEEQRYVLDLLMDGYSLQDIAQEQQKTAYQIERTFRNAVHRIVRQNDLTWKEIHEQDRENRKLSGSNVLGEEPQ